MVRVREDGDDGSQSFTLEHLAVVRVRAGAAGEADVREGTVLGRSRAEDGSEAYAVWFEERGETAMLALADLEPTGELRARRDVYPEGSSH
ncbi:MAG: hypothetical protein GX593_10230 [Actinomycetales bacterium]|nr:hypothetical protein [Actinomycetales bacterium]